MTGLAPEARLRGGTVRGAWDEGIAVFRGIPYAEPPVGPLRFAAPRPAGGWPGVRPAVAFGPPPPQRGPVRGDNWLTINVWTPAPGFSGRLPVMVWVYGGGYVIGSASRPEYDGARLAREGQVVVVTFDYRLGVEGFALIEGHPANRGLLDQVAALEWVRDNIAALGGDPGQVTVFGESAGAGCVAALLAAPRAAGLFRRAIVQSLPGVYFFPDLATDITERISESAHKRPFIDNSPESLVAAADRVVMPARWGAAAYRSILFSPVVDGDVLPTTPWDGPNRDVELLIGHTRDEQRLFTALEGRLGSVTASDAAEAVRILAPWADYGEPDPEKLYEIVQSDWLFRMPTLRLAETAHHAYLYELAWPAPVGLGACHGLDVPLVFGNLTQGEPAVLFGDGPSADAEALSLEMRTAWTDFATRGDPGWPVWDTGRLTKVFDRPSSVVPYPEERSRQLWRDHRFAPLGLR